MIHFVLYALLTLLTAGLLLLAAYLVGLTLAALLGRRKRPPASTATRRFAILVPAHNEEALIRRLLENLQQLDYPKSGFDVHLVIGASDTKAQNFKFALPAAK